MPEDDAHMPSEDEDFDITTQFDSTNGDKTEGESEIVTPASDESSQVEPDTAEPDQVPPVEETEAEDSGNSESTEDAENTENNAAAESENSSPASDTKLAETLARQDPSPTSSPSPRPAFSGHDPSFKSPETVAVRQAQSPSTPSSPVASSFNSPQVSVKQPVIGLKPKRGFPWRYSLEIILAILVVGLAVSSWVLYNDRQDLNQEVASLRADPQAIVAQQTQDLINAVSKLMQLPQGETPTIAVVSNVSAARKQSAFFDKAQNGDKLLLYPKAGEAILYRPSSNKVIEVGPLTLTNSGTTSSASTSGTTSVK